MKIQVTIRRNGMLIERVLLEPAFQEVFGESTLVYCAEEPNGKCFVMPDAIEPTGQDWRKVYWNPKTNEFSEMDLEVGAF